MQIYVCDICGEELPNGIKSIEEEKELLANNPKGMFSLDYYPVMADADGKPVGFGFQPVHTCRYCRTTISHAILNEIGRIQESVHKPSVIIPIRKFDTSPVKEPPVPVNRACYD